MDDWEIEGMPGVGGNCTYCGDNLCAECAGEWDEDGECQRCQNTGKSYEKMTIRELEFLLPVTIEVKEIMENPCPNCTRKEYHTVIYEQRLLRFDSYYQNNKSRTYEISYRKQNNSSRILCRTDRHNDLKAVLIDAHQMLDQLEVRKPEQGVSIT
jgi:hypothetical protein